MGVFLSVLLGLNIFPILMTSKKQSLDSLRKVADMTKSGVFVTDYNANIIYANQSFLNITGYTMDELYKKNPRILKSDMHDQSFYAAMWQQLPSEGYWEGNFWDKKKSGALYPKYSKISRIEDALFKKPYYVAVQEDLTGQNDRDYIA